MSRISAGATQRGSSADFKAAAAEIVSTPHRGASTGDTGGSLVVTVAVTAATGSSPTLKVVVEGSVDNDATWFVLGYISGAGYSVGSVDGSGAAFSAPGTVTGAFPLTARVRTRSLVGGGSPSFTYSVAGIVC